MLREGYIPFITALTKSTQDGILSWSKGESPRAYYSNPTPSQKVSMDKYFSYAEGQMLTCLNLTIFNEEDIIDEIVLCKAVDAPEEYDLLDRLYKAVEVQFDNAEGKNISSLLNQLTQSLEQMMQTHTHP